MDFWEKLAALFNILVKRTTPHKVRVDASWPSLSKYSTAAAPTGLHLATVHSSARHPRAIYSTNLLLRMHGNHFTLDRKELQAHVWVGVGAGAVNFRQDTLCPLASSFQPRPHLPHLFVVSQEKNLAACYYAAGFLHRLPNLCSGHAAGVAGERLRYCSGHRRPAAENKRRGRPKHQQCA